MKGPVYNGGGWGEITESMKLKTFTVHIHMKDTHALIYRRPPPGFQWIYKMIHIIFTF